MTRAFLSFAVVAGDELAGIRVLGLGVWVYGGSMASSILGKGRGPVAVAGSTVVWRFNRR